MTNMISNWNGTIELNGNAIDKNFDFSKVNGKLHLVFRPVQNSAVKSVNSTNKVEGVTGTYKITVKPYMTKKATPEFDFMARWNNNIEMPLRVMTGEVVKETKGMVYMKLHGQGEKTIHCMRCGRELTNPISRHYGIGPECIQKIGLAYDIDAVDKIKEALVDVTWEGWMPKSAIIEKEEVN